MARVDSLNRFDCFISFHGSQRLSSLGFPFHDEYPTVRDFADLLSESLRDIEARHPSIFIDSEVLAGHIDDLFDAVLQLRGGGVALILLTCKFLESKYCLAELRAFLTLDRLRTKTGRKDEAVNLRVVCLEPDAPGETGVNRVLNLLDRMSHNPAVAPFIVGLKGLVLHPVKRDEDTTVEDAVSQVCGHVKRCWSDARSCLGADRRTSFIDMQRFFVNGDAFDLALELNAAEGNTAARVIEGARRDGIISYTDVSSLLKAADVCRQKDAVKGAVLAYQRKWCSEKWSWTATRRGELSRFLREAEEAQRKLLADRTLGFTAVAEFTFNRDTRSFSVAPTSSSAAIPVSPNGIKMVTIAGPDTLNSAEEYPVLRVGNVTFWPMGYIDNRMSMAIVACNKDGHVVHVMPRVGARYVCRIDQDIRLREAIIVGQGGHSVRVKWNELTEIAETFGGGGSNTE